MRLKSIKLAGFKSFVDPTHLSFKGNLTAIVGPNGCGKSNIVDAIYCVLGSNSKNLRAEQMADVIFNGTSSRKPIGQATVELIFDPSESSFTGEFAQYAELAIRRELYRDGQSQYYLNGTRCRRRDITDIFLGTGLGPNSYAIIEQGMISRLIEAKPDELRALVEEAAGTSKYKERRRETENRIKHTRENLDRLNDLRTEQTKQLSHLQRQAQAAEKFKSLKSEQHLLKSQLQAILWQALNQKMLTLNDKISQQESLLIDKKNQLEEIDQEIDSKRCLRNESQVSHSQIQEEFYRHKTEINRLEQAIAHSKEKRAQIENEYAQLEKANKEIKQQLIQDQEKCQELSLTSAEMVLCYEQVREQASDTSEQLKNEEEKMQHWQEKWDEFNRACANSSKQAEVEKIKLTHLSQKQATLDKRICRVKEELAQQKDDHLSEELQLMQGQQEQCQLQMTTLQEHLDSIQKNYHFQRERCQETQKEVAQLTKQLRDLQAQFASTKALQQIALGKNKTEVNKWLSKNQLDDKPRLAEGLDVEPGWETAVETVLADYLDALCVQDFNSLSEICQTITNAEVAFFNINSTTSASCSQAATLADKVSSNWPIHSLLKSVHTVDTLSQAIIELEQLQPDASIITRDGIWISHAWLRIKKQRSEKSGVLQREQHLKELQLQINEQKQQLAKQELIYTEAQESVNRLTEEKESVQQQLQTVRAKNSELLAQIQAKESFLQQIQQKYSSLAEELVENEEQLKDVVHLIEETKTCIQDVTIKALEEDKMRQALYEERDQQRSYLDEMRSLANTYRQKSDELCVRLDSTKNQIAYLEQNSERLQRQLNNAEEKRLILREQLQSENDPLPELTLRQAKAVEDLHALEQNMQQAKGVLAQCDQLLQQLEKKRHELEKHYQEERNSLEQIRLENQSYSVKLQAYEEQIIEAGYLLADLLINLPEEAEASVWQENLTKVEQKIQRLGAINLAAIDEYQSLLERKEYLDKQHDDLVEALTILENAIRKIDKETRIRFKETFTSLNESFKSYFTQVFEGGTAFLELTSDDMLETGVVVKAQPPGKRNSTIHLLSGGEKALTAIALVFAIFNLNPAPFCVLDEVDAPLDDLNVGRFCNLVKKMAEKVQFIFISHNKIAIEMGQQLAGVTMNEPGVSRLVSVDIDQAISMATT